MIRRSPLLLHRVLLALGAAPTACGGATSGASEPAVDAAPALLDVASAEADGTPGDSPLVAAGDAPHDAALLDVAPLDASADVAREAALTIRRPFFVGASLRSAL